MAGDFFNERGEIDTAREGNLYKQGLENQARISANQTAGVGKLGELTRDEMNAIQYGAQAGALGQIAQGRALRSVHGTDSAGFEASYSKTAYMNAHQSLSFQKGSAQAYDAETHGGNIRTAESMGRVSNASSLRGHTKSLEASDGSEAGMISANASVAAKKAQETYDGFKTGEKLGVFKSDGGINSEATTIDKGGYGNNENSYTFNPRDKLRKAAELKTSKGLMEEAQTEEVAEAVAEEGRNKIADQQKNLENSKAGDWTIGAHSALRKWTAGTLGQTREQLAQKNQMIDAEIEKLDQKDTELLRASGNMSAIGVALASTGIQGQVGDMSVSVQGQVGHRMTGGFQSGISYSHNDSRSYSYGTSISGGSALASLGMNMGMSAQGFASASSVIAGAGQIAGAAASVLPGGAMGKGMANLGMISHESGMAMGISAARATTSKNAASALSDGNGFMEKVASFNAGGGIGQLRADMNMAHSSYLSSIGTAGEAAAKKAWQGAQRSYNRGLATEASLARQYNALSPQARAIVDKEMGHSAFGNAGGGVTSGFGGVVPVQ